MTDLNKLATKVTLAEGKKVSLSIAQIKEVLKLVFKELKQLNIEELATLLKRVK